MEKGGVIMGKERCGVNVLISGNRCHRCSHAWIPRVADEIPETCPSCKSPYWQKPKKIFKKGEKKNVK